jgi:transcriptional regulator with XRE-family HTH domain
MQINRAALTAWRLKAGFSMRELARQVGTSASYISNIEHGHRSPSEAMTTRLADALGIVPADLYPTSCPLCGGDAPSAALHRLHKAAHRAPKASRAVR